jgi:hypothetical protein
MWPLEHPKSIVYGGTAFNFADFLCDYEAVDIQSR